MDSLSWYQWQLNIPLHMRWGEIIRIDFPVKGLCLLVIVLRPTVDALKMDAKQRALVIQHPETVAEVKTDAPAPQIVLLRVA